MAIENSTLEQLIERVRNQFSAILPASDSWLYPNNLWIVTTVLGGLFWEALGTVRKMPDLIMPDSATGEYLERWAALYGIQRILASKASGDVIVSGSMGTNIPLGTVFTARGQSFVSSSLPVWKSDGTAMVGVTAEKVGDQANLPANTVLVANSQIAGITGYVVSGTGITGGLCDESDDDLRERMLLRMRSRKRYGTLCDFRDWALEVVGVKRAWVKRETVGIVVYVELDGASIDEVNAYLNDECRKPVCAIVKAIEVIPQTISLILPCLIAPDEATKTLIQTNLANWLFDNATPGECVSSAQFKHELCRIEKYASIADVVFCPQSNAHLLSDLSISYG